MPTGRGNSLASAGTGGLILKESTRQHAVVPESVQPIVEILPIQMLSLALAARDGMEAGRFERASKITNVA